MSNKSKVALVKGEDIQANVTKVFDLLGGVENLIHKGSVVMLKPNAGHAEPPETSIRKLSARSSEKLRRLSLRRS